MKTIQLTLAIVATSILLASCSDSKNDMAQEKIEGYTAFVDSISKVATNEAANNWEAIDNEYQVIKFDVENTVITIEKNDEMQQSIDQATLKYETYMAEVRAENERIAVVNSKNIMRQTLLGKSYDGNDMTFTWINKDNILSVYQNFVDTVSANKDNYSREDWDEIKLLYEAIDTRKNTVEKEGLSSEDNNKIAGLKLKFAPMYTVNRMGSKSDENATAKQ